MKFKAFLIYDKRDIRKCICSIFLFIILLNDEFTSNMFSGGGGGGVGLFKGFPRITLG